MRRQEFYDAVLNRVVTALAAVGGAIWTVTETGQLSLEYQINLRETRLAESEEDQVRHGRLLRKVMTGGEGMLMAPHSGGRAAPRTARIRPNFLLVLGPLKTANETAGVMEIFQRPGSSVTVQRGYLRFLMQMCELASEYLKSRKLQHFTDRQALWAQLEQFTRLVHKGLDPRETAYTIANEGRRLIECDRVSVAIMPRADHENRGRQRSGHLRQALQHRDAAHAPGQGRGRHGRNRMVHGRHLDDGAAGRRGGARIRRRGALQGRGHRAAEGAARQDRPDGEAPRCSAP